jgi:hypothetical protein
MRIAKLILSGDSQGKQFIQRMVDEIVADLRKQEYEKTMSDYDDEDEDDLDDIDLSSLGL